MRDDLNAACAAQPGLMAGIQALLLQHEVEQFYHREAACWTSGASRTGSNCWPMT